MSYKQRLREAVRRTGTTLCVGIDPDLEVTGGFLQGERERLGAGRYLETYGIALIDAVTGQAPAVKPQSAFFEAAGPEGVAALGRVIAYAKSKGLITVLDAKRGDIASTMRAYGRAAFDLLRADALTVTPYMGFDVVEPLIDPWLRGERGVYVVWYSSNPGGALVQDATHVAVLAAFQEAARERGVPDACGYVVGATRADALAPATLTALRGEALLVPGVGAQGGAISRDLADVMDAGGCSLVNVSRGLLQTPDSAPVSWRELAEVVQRNVVAYRRELRSGAFEQPG